MKILQETKTVGGERLGRRITRSNDHVRSNLRMSRWQKTEDLGGVFPHYFQTNLSSLLHRGLFVSSTLSFRRRYLGRQRFCVSGSIHSSIFARHLTSYILDACPYQIYCPFSISPIRSLPTSITYFSYCSTWYLV